jgi:hypothetical protein
VRNLLEDNHKVRALVRDPTSKAAEELSSLGVELAVGDLDDIISLNEAVQGVDGVFSVQAVSMTDGVEVQQGKTWLPQLSKLVSSTLFIHQLMEQADTSLSLDGVKDDGLSNTGKTNTVLKKLFKKATSSTGLS